MTEWNTMYSAMVIAKIPQSRLRQGVPQGAVQDSLYRLHGRQDTRGGRNQAEADFRLRAKERI